jgi:hypothetical protein
MPVISRFLGISIIMYWNDHNPPHFHAKYGEFEVVVSIDKGVVEGKFPKRALKLVLEWLDLHTDDLKDNWQRAKDGKPLKPIKPLE